MNAIQQWALTAPADDFWKISILLVVLSIAGFCLGFYYLLRKRIIEDTPTSKIRSAAQGYVELVGTGEVLEGAPIVAPLTGTTCTWFSYSIAERRYSGKRRRWVTIQQDTSEQNFRLVDDTGESVIDPEGAAVTPSESETWYGHSPFPQPGSRTSTGFLSRGRYRYIEKRMHPGDPLYAIGLFKSTGGSNARFDVNADVRALLSEWKQDSDRLLAEHDTDRDGEIDLDEWNHVREAALDTVRQRHSELKSLPPVHILGKTCDRRRPFLLSALPQPDLLKRFSWFARAGISSFFLGGFAGSWLIITRLGG